MDVAVEIPKYTVIQYVRHKGGKKKNAPYGVVVGMKMDGGFNVGYSLCNKKDRFNKKIALKIAVGRVYQGSTVVAGQSKLPHEVRKMMPAFVARCLKYYKLNPDGVVGWHEPEDK
jgi:hypothetical protein